jgi:transcriptional regulator with XRE-family HTH domain
MVGSSPPTVVDEAAETLALLHPRRLGSLLWTRRKEAHIGALPAARAAGIEITALDDIESGRTPPDATVLTALLKCYGVTPAEFVPPRVPLVTTTSDAASDEILRGFVDAVRKWRKSGRKGKLNFRENDLLALGQALGTDPDEIERRLIAMTGCSPAEAGLLRKRFLAALVTIPVAAALLGGVVPTAAAATRTSSPSSANAASATTVLQGTLRPGSLSLKVADPKLGAVRADGSMPLTVSYVITDARGSGAGWTAQATFTSTDAAAYPTLETLHNVNGEANLPQTPALPASLTSTPAVIAQAAPGTEGMGSFAGHLELSIIGQTAHSSGQLALTFAAPASA